MICKQLDRVNPEFVKEAHELVLFDSCVFVCLMYISIILGFPKGVIKVHIFKRLTECRPNRKRNGRTDGWTYRHCILWAIYELHVLVRLGLLAYINPQ